MYRFGPFQVDFQRSELRKSGYPIRIQEQPLRILETLLESPGELVTRERLKVRPLAFRCLRRLRTQSQCGSRETTSGAAGLGGSTNLH
jgi:hypothetical protein